MDARRGASLGAGTKEDTTFHVSVCLPPGQRKRHDISRQSMLLPGLYFDERNTQEDDYDAEPLAPLQLFAQENPR